MHANSIQQMRTTSRTQTGVVLSARRIDPADELQIVHVALDGEPLETFSGSSHWLNQALTNPLSANTLHFVRHDSTAGSAWFLLDAVPDPQRSGFPHLPESACPVDGVVLDVKALVRSIGTAPLRNFLMWVLERRDVFQNFWTMPASYKHHHSRAGGLAVHSLEVANDLASHGDLLEEERDLGVAGALLHDIGKVWSYADNMFLNEAGLAMGHELIGLSRLEPELVGLEQLWPDGAYVMRCLLSGHTHRRSNGTIPTSLLARIKACDQRSCERDRVRNPNPNSASPVWVPQPWQEQVTWDNFDLW